MVEGNSAREGTKGNGRKRKGNRSSVEPGEVSRKGILCSSWASNSVAVQQICTYILLFFFLIPPFLALSSSLSSSSPSSSSSSSYSPSFFFLPNSFHFFCCLFPLITALSVLKTAIFWRAGGEFDINKEDRKTQWINNRAISANDSVTDDNRLRWLWYCFVCPATVISIRCLSSK